MTDPIGFLVEEVVADSETRGHLIGRCGDTPISLGDVFHNVFAPAARPGGAYQGLGEQSAVQLTVERIQAYEHQLAKLERGMTGTIDVRGEGLNRVVSGAVLETPASVQVTELTEHAQAAVARQRT